MRDKNALPKARSQKVYSAAVDLALTYSDWVTRVEGFPLLGGAYG